MKGGTVQINWHETKPVLTLDFHPLSATLATGGADFDIKLWSINSAEAQKKLPVVTYLNSLSYHSSAVNVIRFSSSGELLASGADGGDLIIWKLHPTDTGQTWKVLKMLRSHHKDVLDLQWSPDAAFIISGSVDNSCIIWDVNKGSNLQTLDAHAHYVQGVAWDPLGKYIASLSSDRTCRIYMNRPKKSKGSERINYVCQQIISKAEYPLLENSKSINYHLFHDETLPSFFRRLAWSPDGSFLLVPAGSYRNTSGSESINAAYIFSRKDFSRPAIQLPCASKAVVAVRFCPINFSLRGINSAGLFKLPYRIIFAVATLNSLYIYDTENNPPIAIMAGLHYASITDIAWSPDAHYLALSSQDGYCTLVEFESNELGSPISLSGEKKVSNTDGKKSLQTADGMVIEASRNVGSVEAESSKTETEAKVDDVVTEGTSNVDVAVAESRKTEAEEKGDDMVIEEPSNCGKVIAESKKIEAEEKDDMVIDATGNVGAVVTDSSKNEAEDKAEKQPLSSDTMKSEAKEMAENQPSSLVNVRKEAEERTEKPRSSSDGIKSEAEAEKQTSSLDNLKREAEENACSSKGMPMSNKQGKKRITPIAIDP